MTNPDTFPRSLIARLLGDRTGLPHSTDREWIGGYMLGSGGQGIVSLWISVDKATQMSVSSIAIKDVYSLDSPAEPAKYAGIYDTLRSRGLDWGVNVEGPGAAAHSDRRFFREAYMMGLLTNFGGPPNNAVPLLGYTKRDTQISLGTRWRLYMPFYEYGTLDKLIEEHTIANKHIPEPFIWYTFISLLTAARQMETEVRKRPNAVKDEVMVFSDIKLENILLAAPDDTSFPVYPKSHLADLGGAVLTHPDDDENINKRLPWVITPEFIAPEMHNDGTQPAGSIAGSPTNIWQIGLVIEMMMRLVRWQPARRLDLNPESDIYNFKPFARQDKTYSHDLKTLVFECQRFRPEHRPTPELALQWIGERKTIFDGMDTWGTWGWINERKLTADLEKATLEPRVAEVVESPPRKRKRVQKADAYLRNWPSDRRQAYLDLDDHVPEGLGIEYGNDTKDLFRLGRRTLNADGTPVHSYKYRDSAAGPRPLTKHLNPRAKMALDARRAEDARMAKASRDAAHQRMVGKMIRRRKEAATIHPRGEPPRTPDGADDEAERRRAVEDVTRRAGEASIIRVVEDGVPRAAEGGLRPPGAEYVEADDDEDEEYVRSLVEAGDDDDDYPDLPGYP